VLLQGKNAIVTGAYQGIGKEIASKFVKEGANVLLIDINEKIIETAQELQTLNGNSKIVAIQKNLANISLLSEIIEEIKHHFDKIDILVNNAGIYRTENIADITEDSWDQVFTINLKTAFFLSKEIVELMKENESGCILNLSSVAGKKGRPYGAHYAASKAAVISITKSFAEAYGKYGIRTNALCPGIIRTSMIESIIHNRSALENKTTDEIEQQYLEKIPLNKLGTPDDVGQFAAVICSDYSSYINGQAINVCGGFETD